MVQSCHGEREGGTVFVLALLASTFLMGSSFVASKILVGAGIPPMILVGSRFMVAALVTLPLVRLEGGRVSRALWPRRPNLRETCLIVTIGLLQTALVMWLLSIAMRTISAPTAAILLSTGSIWIVLLGRLFLGEPLHRARIVGMTLGIAGVLLSIGFLPGAFAAGVQAGDLVDIAAAFCFAAATILNKRAGLPIGSWALSFWQMFIGATALLGTGYSLGQRWPGGMTIAEWGWFFWLAVPASAGSFGLWFLALSRAGAIRTSSFLFLCPLFTAVMSFTVLGTGLSWGEFTGGLLIGSALWLINRSDPAQAPQATGIEERLEVEMGQRPVAQHGYDRSRA